jgi:hypothetical protein
VEDISMPMDDREFNVSIRNQRMATGMSSEMTCAADCFSRGYQVSKPLAGDCKYDLIVDKANTLLRVQVKTISGSQIPIGSITYRENTYGKGVVERVVPRYDGSEFDILAAVDRTTKRVYYMPVAEINFSKAHVPFGITIRERYSEL